MKDGNVLHLDQIAAGNEIFSPRQSDYDHAELILEAYEWHTSRDGGARGAVMLGDEMIDEASRKMALVIAGGAAPQAWCARRRPVRPRESDPPATRWRWRPSVQQDVDLRARHREPADDGARQRNSVAVLVRCVWFHASP